MGALKRLRPRTHERVAEQLRLVLELPLGLRPETRQEINDALSTYSPEPWAYVMVSREESRRILRQIMKGPRPGTTLAVWEAARSFSEYGTGRIAASPQELAELADT